MKGMCTMLFSEPFNLIEELYFGNICPGEKCYDQNSRYADFMQTISGNEEKLRACFKAHTGAEEEQLLPSSSTRRAKSGVSASLTVSSRASSSVQG